MDYHSMPSQDPALESFAEDIMESGHEELLPNEERGCGHLKHNSTYVRSDAQALGSPSGSIPAFVELDEPVEYREYSDRGAIMPGWKPFPGVRFALAYQNEGYTTTPSNAIEEYQSRLQNLEFDGGHYGDITVAQSHDLIMSVGATHWETPAEYIEETREKGLNLKIPSSTNNPPPVIDPFVTRCWVIHPNGIPAGGTEAARAAIIGYAVLTRCVYTTGENATAADPDIPKYAEEWDETGKVSLATPGEEVSAGGEVDPSLGEFVEDSAEADGGETVVASDKEGRDVESAPPITSSIAEEAPETVESADDEDVPVERQPGYQNAPEEMYKTESETTTGEIGDPEFWEQYDIPIDFATAQNNRIGELQRGSSGTGATESTARHFYVLEAFEDGRLSREAGRFLCLGEGDRPDRPTEPDNDTNPSEITCETCLKRMERWKAEDDDE